MEVMDDVLLVPATLGSLGRLSKKDTPGISNLLGSVDLEVTMKRYFSLSLSLVRDL